MGGDRCHKTSDEEGRIISLCLDEVLIRVTSLVFLEDSVLCLVVFTGLGSHRVGSCKVGTNQNDGTC